MFGDSGLCLIQAAPLANHRDQLFDVDWFADMIVHAGR